MLALWALENPLVLLLLAVLILAFWQFLAGRFDARLFIALNFSIAAVWVAWSDVSLAFRAIVGAYMLLFLFAYALRPQKPLARKADRWLSADLSKALLVVSALALAFNINSGYAVLDDKAQILASQAESTAARYANYLLLMGGWLTVHVINSAGTSRTWTWMQRVAVAVAVAAAATGLSKASVLPIILTFLFVYSSRLSPVKIALALLAGLGVTFLLIQRLLENESAGVAAVFLSRVIQNMDVLDYLETLGIDQIKQYPHSSPFYLFWPFYQMTQTDFVVPGVWLHGTMTDDWRGYGPNATFVIDQIVASNYVGVLLAPVFGMVLRAANSARYRVFIAMICYSFLQDWYFSCINLLLFSLVLGTTKFLQRTRSGGVARRPSKNPLAASL